MAGQPRKLQSIAWLASAGELEAGGQKGEPRDRGREPQNRGRGPEAAAASSSAASSSIDPGRGLAAEAVSTTLAGGGGKKKTTAKSKKVPWEPVAASIPEEMLPVRAPRRWVHIHREHHDSVAFFVDCNSNVGALLPKIAKWFKLHHGVMIELHDDGGAMGRLGKDTTWKELTDWDIEVTIELMVYQ
jgi:hypothetical protein